MKRFFKLSLAFLVLLCVPAISCPPTPLPWDIDDPSNGSLPTYTADIACLGEATTSDAFIVKVVKTNSGTITQSASGTSTACAWSITAPQPTGGWGSGFPGSYSATLQLWVGGVQKDFEAINIAW
ncbi:MAG: hypothetical protein NTU79_03995 [Planctomycetota bacterium]|nr:hypothetical protein [Planctomycetota bacterium]